MNLQFPAKILLFGEHILLKGATALAIPSTTFYGEWRQTDAPESVTLRDQLTAAAKRLEATAHLRISDLQHDIENGWIFQSNIPQGYGMGSSGALCAALYARYNSAPHLTEPGALKQILGAIESTFHGSSSGIDPLTSYLSKPVLIRNTRQAIPLTSCPVPEGIRLFLIDSHQPRQTDALVQWFLEQCEQESFYTRLRNEILPIHEAMIDQWLTGDGDAFFQTLYDISRWQSLTLSPMLPANHKLMQWWLDELKQDHIRFKICGAGGGGFLMGFTNNVQSLESKADTLGFKVVYPLIKKETAL